MGDDLDTVKSIFRRIFWANKGPLTWDKLLGEYKSCTGETFCCTNYGYGSLQDFLGSVTDIITIQRGLNDDLLLYSVEDEASCQVQNLIKDQRNKKQVIRKKISSSQRQIEGAISPDDHHSTIQNGVSINIQQRVAGSHSVCDTNPISSPQRRDNRMEQSDPGRGRGRGRGRGMMMQHALAEVCGQTKSDNPGTRSADTPAVVPATESSNDLVPEKFIKIWIVKELHKSPGGVWFKALPKRFKENFNREPPADLLEKLKSWSDLIETQNLLPGPMMKLRNYNHEAQQKETKAAPPIQTPQEQSNSAKPDNESTEPKSVVIPEEGEFLDITVEWSNGPGEFCMIPFKLVSSLEHMVKEMNTYFQSRTEPIKPMQKSSLYPGKLCAGYLKDTWYRIITKTHANEENMIQAELPDFCFKTEIHTDNVKELPARFHSLPLFGIKARLYGVAPVDGIQWTDVDKADFSTIVENRNFVCVIREKNDKEGIVGVRLVDTSQEEDVIVDEELEKIGCIKRV